MKHITHPSRGEFTPTSLETYLECPRKYYLSRILAMQPVLGKASLDFGSAIHAGIGAYYMNQNESHEARLIAMLRAFGSAWNPEKETEKHSAINGINLLKTYAAVYRYDTGKYVPEKIELDVRCVMPNNTTMVGRIDRALIDQNMIIAVDSKTTTMSLTDWFWKNFENSFQMLTYPHILRTILGGCDGIMVDAISFPVNPAVPEKHFQRRTLPFTSQQEQDWMNTYLEVTNEIMHLLTLPEEEQFRKFRACHTSCSNYGGCTYLPICRFGLTHPDAKLMFRRDVDD